MKKIWRSRLIEDQYWREWRRIIPRYLVQNLIVSCNFIRFTVFVSSTKAKQAPKMTDFDENEFSEPSIPI